jgi:hypothetical protein
MSQGRSLSHHKLALQYLVIRALGLDALDQMKEGAVRETQWRSGNHRRQLLPSDDWLRAACGFSSIVCFRRLAVARLRLKSSTTRGDDVTENPAESQGDTCFANAAEECAQLVKHCSVF